MSENTNLGLTVEAWAEIVIERWIRKILRLRMSGDQLVKSFAYSVINDSNGDPDLIQFAFEYYGKFVDMGVGKGVPFDRVEDSNRRPKPWYSKKFNAELKALKEILAEKYQRKGQLIFITNIDDNAEKRTEKKI